VTVSAAIVEEAVNTILGSLSVGYFINLSEEAVLELENERNVSCIVVFEEIELCEASTYSFLLNSISIEFPGKPIVWIRSKLLSVLDETDLPMKPNIFCVDIENIKKMSVQSLILQL